nr:hypothetical protein [Streptomyces radicis]
MPGDDEQGVVDADGEAEHDRQGQRVLRDVEVGGGEQRSADRAAHAEDRGEDRDPGRHDGAEGDEHDEERDADADGLGGAERGELLLEGVAAEDDTSAALAEPLVERRAGRAHRLLLRGGDLGVRREVEGDGGDRHPAVLRDPLQRIAHLRDHVHGAHPFHDGAHLPGDRLVVHPRAVRGDEQDVAFDAARLGEVPIHRLESGLRGGAGNRVAGREGSRERERQGEHRRQQRQRRAEEEESATGRRGPQPIQERGHRSAFHDGW